MDTVSAFMAYAGDFEKTFEDDDWSRLHKHFTEDAVYEIKGGEMDCRLQGPDAIFRGMKKSLDGFDRKFEGRDINVLGAPEVDGDNMSVAWTVTYKKGDFDPFVLRGKSEAKLRNGKIAYLCDSYDRKMAEEAMAWQSKTGFRFDGSYV